METWKKFVIRWIIKRFRNGIVKLEFEDFRNRFKVIIILNKFFKSHYLKALKAYYKEKFLYQFHYLIKLIINLLKILIKMMKNYCF